MGQSRQSRFAPPSKWGRTEELGQARISLFSTDIGWLGFLGNERGVVSLTIGHHSAEEVRAALTHHWRQWGCPPGNVTAGSVKGGDLEHRADELVESDWLPEWRQRVQQYLQGQRVSWAGFPFIWPKLSPFQTAVLAATQAIPHGETRTYGEIAAQVGHPGAARAVGTVMSSNRFPLVIPCHRVVASGGLLGGYTSPQGLRLKEYLLAMERGALLAAR